MLDEWMEQKVDEACEAVPAYVNPRKIRLASSHAGWRLYLYGSSIKRAVCGFFVHIKTADDMDLFLRETAERSDTTLNHIKRFFREKARLLAVLDDAGMRLRFVTALFLFGLASLGTLAVGGREMALCALAASTTGVNHGWFAVSSTNRCPTMPVAPMIPTLNFSMMKAPILKLAGKFRLHIILECNIIHLVCAEIRCSCTMDKCPRIPAASSYHIHSCLSM